MESKKSIAILSVSISLFFSVMFSFTAYSCGFGESSEVIRLAMFRAELFGMSAYRPFYYSANYVNNMQPDPSHFDRIANCKEWMAEIGYSVVFNDIELIQYKTEPDLFLKALDNNNLRMVFDKNTFVEFLTNPANERFLDYMVLAKKAEYANYAESDPWGDGYEESNSIFDLTAYKTDLLNEFLKNIETCGNNFLRKRYTYQIVRMYFQLGDLPNCIASYDKWFGNLQSESIVKTWALLHKANAMAYSGNAIEANYLYSLVFDKSDEKKLRVYQLFYNDTEMFEQTLAMTKNSNEKAALWALAGFKNPGPTLDIIKKINEYAPQSKYLAPLIMREINKLEDWVLASVITPYKEPSLYYQYVEWDVKEREKIIEQNRQKDILYLRQVVDFLKFIYPTSQGELQQFCAISIAHLLFIDDKIEEGKQFLAKIPANASSGIQFQKIIDEVLVNLNTTSIQSDAVKNIFAANLSKLEKMSKKNFEVNKLLYSLMRYMSNVYRNEPITSGLLYMKSEIAKEDFDMKNSEYSQYGYFAHSYYWYLAWFDRNANSTDMENLLTLLKKPNKTKFEQFICNQKLASVSSYIELKGSIAFRENNLDLAYKTYSQLPDNYWDTAYAFKQFLNEDPFIPKSFPYTRNFTYKFSKKNFVKQLLDFQAQAAQDTPNKAEFYLNLGYAFYNCTYWGNSWMMMSYSWSVAPTYDYSSIYNILFYNLYEKQKAIQDVYFKCSIATEYFKKVQSATTDKELLAQAQFMLHCCDYNRYLFTAKQNDWQSDAPQQAEYHPYLMKDFYIIYRNTETFASLHCPLLDDFAGSLGIKK